jgi:hypothetical protein
MNEDFKLTMDELEAVVNHLTELIKPEDAHKTLLGMAAVKLTSIYVAYHMQMQSESLSNNTSTVVH